MAVTALERDRLDHQRESEVLALGLGGEDVAQAGLAHGRVVVGVEQVDQQGGGVEADCPEGGVVDEVALGAVRRQVQVGDVAADGEGGERPPSIPARRRAWPADINTPSGPTAVTASSTAGEVLDRREVAGHGEEAVVEGDDEAPSRLRLQQSA